MNRIAERCQKDSSAKFYYSSKKLFRETKLIKLTLYLLSTVPIIFSLIPKVNEIPNLTFIVTMSVFLLNIIAELGSSLLSSHKEKGILLHQLYEAEITGTSFSKIEYDRELTNELNELAIRKALSKMHRLKNKSYHAVDVPDKIADEYVYLYLCRTNSSAILYLMSRMFYIYVAFLIFLVTAFISFSFVRYDDTKEFLQLIIQFYPLILPIIRNINSCRKSMKYCAKIDADIDNFFADGDDSIERLARFQYYVQNIEFEMLMLNPAKYAIFNVMFKRGTHVLTEGVTQRFIKAIEELKKKALMAKGVTVKTTRKDILTQREIDLEALERKERLLKERERKKLEDDEAITKTTKALKKASTSKTTTIKTKAKKK